MGNGEGVLAGVLFVLFGIPILFVVCADFNTVTFWGIKVSDISGE